MKKILLCVSVASLLCADVIIDIKETPKEILTFVEKNYPNSKILQVQKDINEYEIITNDNTKIEFDANFNLISIDSRSKIADNLLPQKVLEYVKKNYPKNFIKEYEKDNDIEVELDNGITLEFDLNENFIKID